MPSIIDKAAASVARNWSKCVSHAMFFAGLALVVYGAGLIYPPLRFVTGGAVLFWLAMLMEKERREPRS